MLHPLLAIPLALVSVTAILWLALAGYGRLTRDKSAKTRKKPWQFTDGGGADAGGGDGSSGD